MSASRPVMTLVVLALAVLVSAAFAPRPADASEVLLQSEGSSLSPFPCHYLDGAPEPVVDDSDGVPAPSIRYTTDSPATYSLSTPYAVNALLPGSQLHGSMDVKILGVTNEVAVASFGISTRTLCDYDPYAGPWDGRFPLPRIDYLSLGEMVDIWSTNESGQVVLTQMPYTIPLGVWHHVDFLFDARQDGAYAWGFLVDGQLVAQGLSFAPILNPDSLGVIIGADGSYAATDVEYDNIRVEQGITPIVIFFDGFESGTTAAWSAEYP
jgi:hypothetical protein